jgi:hypothetical protein
MIWPGGQNLGCPATFSPTMRYSLTVKTGPTSEPVSRDEAKLHLHETDTAQDTVIDGMIQAAREQTENFISRALLPQTFTMYLDGFPGYGASGGFGLCAYTSTSLLGGIDPLAGILLSSGGEILLPRAPVTVVNSIKYVDTTGATQTLDPTLYQVDPQADDRPVRILPAYGKVWPATRCQPNAVIIEFVAGYADAAHVPATIKLAMKQTLADWYNNRDSVVVDNRVAVQQLPNAAKMLLWDYRLF